MISRKITGLVYAPIFFFAMASQGQEQTDAWNPPFLSLTIPTSGFVMTGPVAGDDDCDTATGPGWIYARGTSFDLWVKAAGPAGAGRYWKLHIGISEKGALGPRGGFCLTTTTLGWRTLKTFSRTPLPWVSDENGNGDPEFILWDSFPLHEDATNAEYAMIGWVYSVDRRGNILLNRDLTRELVTTLAAAYRDPLDGLDAATIRRRLSAASMLERFPGSSTWKTR